MDQTQRCQYQAIALSFDLLKPSIGSKCNLATTTPGLPGWQNLAVQILWSEHRGYLYGPDRSLTLHNFIFAPTKGTLENSQQLQPASTLRNILSSKQDTHQVFVTTSDRILVLSTVWYGLRNNSSQRRQHNRQLEMPNCPKKQLHKTWHHNMRSHAMLLNVVDIN